MKINVWDGNPSQINTRSIKPEVVNNYLKKTGKDSLEKLSYDEACEIFKTIIKDFKNGKLSVDDFSNFGFLLFHKFAKSYPESDLFKATLMSSEISFDIRKSGVNVPIYIENINLFQNRVV